MFQELLTISILTYLEPTTISVFGRIVTAHKLSAGCNKTCCSELCQIFTYLSSPPVTTNEFVISVPQKTLRLEKNIHVNYYNAT